MININDVFWTFQGEGANAGRRALFVRMPFCDLKCSWCDTSFNSFKKWTIDELRNFASQESSRFAVITGGEPMLNKHTQIVIDILAALDFEIACESNGRHPIKEGINFVTISPKRDDNYFVHPDAFMFASEFKYVIDEGFDWKILERHNVLDGKRYSLSPEYGRFDESMKEIFNYIKDHPEWRYSLQTHKILKIP